MFTARLIALRDAHAFVDVHHSHHPPAIGGKFAIGVFVGSRCTCVAVVGRRVARLLDTGAVLEVVRLASDGTHRGAASFALRAVVKEAAARGVHRLVSYTLVGEVGASYRAARWRPTALTRGRQWSCKSRPRKPAAQAGHKVRWEAGRDAMPRSMRAQELVEAQAGRVVLVTRRPTAHEPDVF